MSERIQKVLSRAGLASRREGERLLEAGRVTVNGRVVTRLGTRVEPRDRLALDGKPVRLRRPTYLLMYKPRGCITTMSDPQGRPSVRDLLPEQGPRVFPVGRLDYASEGLLLFTNDGELAQALMHPSSRIAKVYQVKVRGVPGGQALARLRQPFRLAGRRTRPATVHLMRAGNNAILEIVLTEGRKNQIREMCWRIGHPVMRLRRIAVGPLKDETLGSGACRPLTAGEVEALRALALGEHVHERRAGEAG